MPRFTQLPPMGHARDCAPTPQSLNHIAQYETPLWFLLGRYGLNAPAQTLSHYRFTS